jgi:hypothetical protein
MMHVVGLHFFSFFFTNRAAPLRTSSKTSENLEGCHYLVTLAATALSIRSGLAPAQVDNAPSATEHTRVPDEDQNQEER